MIWRNKTMFWKKSAANKQYSSRDCLEISLIPDSISNNNLEEKS